MILTEKDLLRFWNKVDKNGPIVKPELGSCWNWKGHVVRTYGQFSVGKKKLSTHRISWELVNGAVPEGSGFHGTCVLHKCDNRICVRPDHLFLGSQHTNILDAVSKGRMSDGELNGQAKLTPELVRKIRASYIPRIRTLEMVAKEFDISQTLVWMIVHRRLWPQVE